MRIIRTLQSKLEQRVGTQKHDESVLQQSNFWVSSIAWGLIATTGLSVTWLAFAKTEEIVVATGKLVPIGSVQDIQMPIGGIVDEILVKDGDRVKENQILIKLDTEASSQKLKSLEESLLIKRRQLELKDLELARFETLYMDRIKH